MANGRRVLISGDVEVGSYHLNRVIRSLVQEPHLTVRFVFQHAVRFDLESMDSGDQAKVFVSARFMQMIAHERHKMAEDRVWRVDVVEDDNRPSFFCVHESLGTEGRLFIRKEFLDLRNVVDGVLGSLSLRHATASDLRDRGSIVGIDGP